VEYPRGNCGWHIHWLREKLEADPSSPLRIVTVRNIGYRFEG
jgi:DNA-binding response OmpR family regulator